MVNFCVNGKTGAAYFHIGPNSVVAIVISDADLGERCSSANAISLTLAVHLFQAVTFLWWIGSGILKVF